MFVTSELVGKVGPSLVSLTYRAFFCVKSPCRPATLSVGPFANRFTLAYHVHARQLAAYLERAATSAPVRAGCHPRTPSPFTPKQAGGIFYGLCRMIYGSRQRPVVAVLHVGGGGLWTLALEIPEFLKVEHTRIFVVRGT